MNLSDDRNNRNPSGDHPFIEQIRARIDADDGICDDVSAENFSRLRAEAAETIYVRAERIVTGPR